MADSQRSGMNIDTKLVRELAEMLDEPGLTEIAVEDGERKIKVSRSGGIAAPVYHAAPPPAPAGMPSPASAVAAAGGAPASGDAALANAVKSPMVGTVYLAPEPGADDFVKVGDTVAAGDTLLIIEAMKVMNPITATTAGTVRQLLVENAQPVEFDQPLAIVE